MERTTKIRKFRTLSERDKQIYFLRKKRKTLKYIGDKYNLTAERVRQILFPRKKNYCIKHRHFFDTNCYFCSYEQKYSYVLEQCQKDGVLDEIRLLQSPNRSKDLVLKRQLVVRLMHDYYNLPFFFIGKVLNRHHSSIINLYYKKL